jgi:hypothetical protein
VSPGDQVEVDVAACSPLPSSEAHVLYFHDSESLTNPNNPSELVSKPITWIGNEVHASFAIPTDAAVGEALIVVDCGQNSNAAAYVDVLAGH